MSAVDKNAVMETERLVLRRLVPEDFVAVRRIQSDPEVMAVYGGAFPEQSTRDYIQRNIDRYAKDGVGFYAITLRDSGELIGCGGIVMQETDQGIEPEIGYQIRRDRQGRGYATEMARACMRYAFEVLGTDHIISLIRPDNAPSRRVAEKNGLAVDREFLWRDQLHLVYRMTKSHWEKLASVV
jgi:RimJ/RimL family protein N-acetyltransferase